MLHDRSNGGAVIKKRNDDVRKSVVGGRKTILSHEYRVTNISIWPSPDRHPPLVTAENNYDSEYKSYS